MILRLRALLVTVALAGAALSGCLGGEDGDGTPTAFFTVTPKEDGVTFLFDALNSSDPQGEELGVEWNFGDDGEQFGPLRDFGLIEYTYAVSDTTFMVSLVVRDPDGSSAFMMEQVSLGTGMNTAPEAHLKNATRWVKVGGGVVLDASRSDDHEGDLFSYEWILGNYSAETANMTLDTGLLGPGMSANLTFDAAGVYLFHCHPHPWMKMRVVVSDEDPNATSDATVDIRNFGYSEKTLAVTPGATVRFHNVDPVEHTATLEWFAPGQVVATSPILSQKLQEGDYQARLVLNDGKGGMASTTYGLRASADAPPNPRVTYLNWTPVDSGPGALAAQPRVTDYTADWPQNLTGSISWNGNTGATYRIELLQAGQVVAGCFAEEGTCTFATNIVPGDYQIRQAVSGNAVRETAPSTLSAIQYTNPGFGDSDMGDGGEHHH